MRILLILLEVCLNSTQYGIDKDNAMFNDIDFIVFDPTKTLNLSLQNYYTDNFDAVLDKIISYLDQLIGANSNNKGIILVYGLAKFILSIDKK